MTHDIRWGIDPDIKPVEKHAYHLGQASKKIKTLCGKTFSPVPISQLPHQHQYAGSCRQCRVIAWGKVNPRSAYPSKH